MSGARFEDTLRARPVIDYGDGEVSLSVKERDVLADAIRIARTWTENTALSSLTNEQCRELMRAALARLDGTADPV